MTAPRIAVRARTLSVVFSTFLALLLVLLVPAGLTGCDLVVYDAFAVDGARRAGDLALEHTFRIDDWDVRTDDDALSVPSAFYPASLDRSSGFLLADSDQGIQVIWIESSRVVVGRSFFVPHDVPSAGWEAWIVAPDAAIQTDPAIPLLLVAIWEHGGPPNLFAVRPSGGVDGSMDEVWVDAAPVVQSALGLPDPPETLSYQVVTFVPGDRLPDGSTAPLSGAILQVLYREPSTGEVGEYFLEGTAAQFAEWLFAGNAAVMDGSSVSRSITVPNRTDGDRPRHVRYGNGIGSLRAVLSFPDGDYRGAPERTFLWDSGVGAVPIAVPDTFRPSSVTFDGMVRDGRRGTVTVFDLSSAGIAARREENGSLWYAGRYASGAGTTSTDPAAIPSRTARDVYTQVGLTRTVGGDGRLTLAVYSSR